MDLLKNFWDEDAFGKLIAIFMVTLAGVILLVIVMVVDATIPSPKREVASTVLRKKFTPAHSTTTIVSSGKGFVPVSTFHPDKAELVFEIEGETLNCAVDGQFYSATRPGDVLKVTYRTGVVFGFLYCDDVR